MNETVQELAELAEHARQAAVRYAADKAVQTAVWAFQRWIDPTYRQAQRVADAAAVLHLDMIFRGFVCEEHPSARALADALDGKS